MDRNGNGMLEPDELGFMRGMLERNGRDVSQPISKADFVEMSRQMMERFSQRGGAGGGFPGRGDSRRGPGGPPGSEASPDASKDAADKADGADSGDGRRRGRGRRDRGGEGTDGNKSGADAKGGDRKDSDGTTKSATPPAGGKGPPKRPQSLTLPEQHAARDSNGDGQIGLYEWPKNDYSGFARLDLNGDGFVTPQELARESRRKGGKLASGSAMKGDSGAADIGKDAPAESPSAGGPGGRRGGRPPADEKSPAERAFTLLDQDKDESITESEWQRSVSVRSMFERANTAVTLPLSKADFLRLYPAPGN